MNTKVLALMSKLTIIQLVEEKNSLISENIYSEGIIKYTTRNPFPQVNK